MPRAYIGTCTFTAILACLLIPATDASKKHCMENCATLDCHEKQVDRAIEAHHLEGSLDGPSANERTPAAAGAGSIRSSSQGLSRPWIPPLAKHSTELISPSDFPLARSRTCDTSSSSHNSRTRSASLSTLSRHPSTASSLSRQTITSQTRIISSKPTSTLSNSKSKPALPAIPTKYLHPSHSLKAGGPPLRPGSRPAMPPDEFWDFFDKQRLRDTYVSNATADSHSHKAPNYLIDKAGKREPSVCRYPILATRARPVCRARRATVQSETAHIKNASYETVRKGPLDYSGRIRSMAMGGEGGDADAAVSGGHGKRASTKAGPKRRESRTLTKQRQPSHK
ncbi:MAG: hypothetical protein Q9168_007721 [Polycauliona sp. 1 TL-2023]